MSPRDRTTWERARCELPTSSGLRAPRRSALLPVELTGLLAEEPVDVGIAAIDVRAPGGDERLQAGRRVSEGPAQAVDEILELLVLVPTEESGALERSELHPDPDGLEI